MAKDPISEEGNNNIEQGAPRPETSPDALSVENAPEAIAAQTNDALNTVASEQGSKNFEKASPAAQEEIRQIGEQAVEKLKKARDQARKDYDAVKNLPDKATKEAAKKKWDNAREALGKAHPQLAKEIKDRQKNKTKGITPEEQADTTGKIEQKATPEEIAKALRLLTDYKYQMRLRSQVFKDGDKRRLPSIDKKIAALDAQIGSDDMKEDAINIARQRLAEELKANKKDSPVVVQPVQTNEEQTAEILDRLNPRTPEKIIAGLRTGKEPFGGSKKRRDENDDDGDSRGGNRSGKATNKVRRGDRSVRNTPEFEKPNAPQYSPLARVENAPEEPAPVIKPEEKPVVAAEKPVESKPKENKFTLQAAEVFLAELKTLKADLEEKLKRAQTAHDEAPRSERVYREEIYRAINAIRAQIREKKEEEVAVEKSRRSQETQVAYENKFRDLMAAVRGLRDIPEKIAILDAAYNEAKADKENALDTVRFREEVTTKIKELKKLLPKNSPAKANIANKNPAGNAETSSVVTAVAANTPEQQTKRQKLAQEVYEFSEAERRGLNNLHDSMMEAKKAEAAKGEKEDASDKEPERGREFYEEFAKQVMISIKNLSPVEKLKAIDLEINNIKNEPVVFASAADGFLQWLLRQRANIVAEVEAAEPTKPPTKKFEAPTKPKVTVLKSPMGSGESKPEENKFTPEAADAFIAELGTLEVSWEDILKDAQAAYNAAPAIATVYREKINAEINAIKYKIRLEKDKVDKEAEAKARRSKRDENAADRARRIEENRVRAEEEEKERARKAAEVETARQVEYEKIEKEAAQKIRATETDLIHSSKNYSASEFIKILVTAREKAFEDLPDGEARNRHVAWLERHIENLNVRADAILTQDQFRRDEHTVSMYKLRDLLIERRDVVETFPDCEAKTSHLKWLENSLATVTEKIQKREQWSKKDYEMHARRIMDYIEGRPLDEKLNTLDIEIAKVNDGPEQNQLESVFLKWLREKKNIIAGEGTEDTDESDQPELETRADYIANEQSVSERIAGLELEDKIAELNRQLAIAEAKPQTRKVKKFIAWLEDRKVELLADNPEVAQADQDEHPEEDTFENPLPPSGRHEDAENVAENNPDVQEDVRARVEGSGRPADSDESQEPQPFNPEPYASVHASEDYSRPPTSIWEKVRGAAHERFGPILDQWTVKSFSKSIDKKYEVYGTIVDSLKYEETVLETINNRIVALKGRMVELREMNDEQMSPAAKEREGRLVTRELVKLAGSSWREMENIMEENVEYIREKVRDLKNEKKWRKAELKNYESKRGGVLTRVDGEFEKKLSPHERKVKELLSRQKRVEARIVELDKQRVKFKEQFAALKSKPGAWKYLTYFNSPTQIAIDKTEKLIAEKQAEFDDIMGDLATLQMKIGTLSHSREEYAELSKSKLNEYEDVTEEASGTENRDASQTAEARAAVEGGEDDEEEDSAPVSTGDTTTESETAPKARASERPERAPRREATFTGEQIDNLKMSPKHFVSIWNNLVAGNSEYTEFKIPPVEKFLIKTEPEGIVNRAVFLKAQEFNLGKKVSLEKGDITTKEMIAFLTAYIEVKQLNKGLGKRVKRFFGRDDFDAALQSFRKNIEKQLVDASV